MNRLRQRKAERELMSEIVGATKSIKLSDGTTASVGMRAWLNDADPRYSQNVTVVDISDPFITVKFDDGHSLKVIPTILQAAKIAPPFVPPVPVTSSSSSIDPVSSVTWAPGLVAPTAGFKVAGRNISFQNLAIAAGVGLGGLVAWKIFSGRR